MASKCPKCDKTVYFAEKVSSLGKDWHKFCLKCERCSKTLTPGGHAEHDGKPFCHKPCYATLFGPKGVNIGGAGSYIYEKPLAEGPQVTGPIEVPAARAEERKASGPPKGPSRASSVTTFTGEPNTCPRCSKKVYFAEKVTSLGKDWHRPCLRCERCGKTLTPGGHAEVRGARRGLGAGQGHGGMRVRGAPGRDGGVGGASGSCAVPSPTASWPARSGSLQVMGRGSLWTPPSAPTFCLSTMASPTATSPAMESSSDPRA
nr:cysteine-rich protein 2 isoform X1 [Chlorocebus sabaeus]